MKKRCRRSVSSPRYSSSQFIPGRKLSSKPSVNCGHSLGQPGAGPHPGLVPFLAKQRDVIGWGSEGVGTDAGQAFRFEPAFPCHSGMHGSNKFGLASLTNLDQLPPKGAILITPPLKIVGGSGSPCRVLALVAA